MPDPITTNPQRSEQVVDKDGLPTDQQIEFNDDIELALNENLLGDSLKTTIYDVTMLPLPQDNRGGIIFVTNIPLVTFGNIPVPCWAANPEPPFVLFSINNVTDNGSGIAQFNHTGNNVLVGERVNISGFIKPVNANYNVTETKVTSATPSSFVISSISFADSETVGKYSRGSNWRNVLTGQIIG